MSERRVEDLFERFRSQGDAAALGRVFDEVAPILQRVARHLAHDRAEAEDLVQATFLTAIEKRDTFDATRRLEPWLTGILLKQASLARRARTRVIESDRLDSRTSEDPLDVAGAREMSEALTVALSRLSPSDREVLLPLLMDGRRAVEIARELGRRPDTVHMRIHRGLARLRRLLPASFAIAALGRASQARGLSAVKAEVLRRASAQFTVASGAGVSVAVATWGIAMTTKQIAVAAAAVAVALAAGGYWLAPMSRGAHAPDLGDHAVGIALPTKDSAAGSTTPTQVAPVALGSTRTELAVLATPDAPRTVVLEILRNDAHPAAGALLAFVDSSKTLTSAKTDEKGLCKLTTSSAVADVYIRDDASLPYHAHVDIAGKDKLTIDLPAGADLSGRLIMIGDEALPYVELKLSTDSAPDGFAEADLAVFKALELMDYGYKEIVARTHPLANGSFHFHGLHSGWSGALVLPQELVLVVDGKATQSSKQLFRSAATGLELSVTYRPRIIGRLVDFGTHEPFPTATVACALNWSDGGDMGSSFKTDASGRFSIPLDYRTDCVGVELQTIHLANGSAAVAAEHPKWTGPCEPRDVGDIACAPIAARPISFRAVDAQGASLRGAHAMVRGLEVVSADDNGIGEFAGVPYDATEMHVVAPGYAIASVRLSKESLSPITVTLEPTNRLTIALPTSAIGRKDLSVSLVSTALLFGGTSRMYPSALHGGMVGWCWSADGDAGTREGAVSIAFSPEGRIELEGVRTRVPFRVQLRGSQSSTLTSEANVLAEVKIDSLGLLEHRLVEFSSEDLAGHPTRILLGRVTDELGQPILGANVGTQLASGAWFVSSGLDGSFKLDIPDRTLTDVEVSKRGYVPFRVHDWNVTLGNRLEAQLRRGHDLRVEFVDPHGIPVDQVYVTALIEGHGPAVIEQVSPGVFTLDDLPDGTVQVSVRVAGRTYVSSHDCHAGVARVTLPEHGRLAVGWSLSTPPTEGSAYQLALRPIDADGIAQIESTPWPDRVPQYTFENVLPGEYTLGFEVGTERTADGEDIIYAPLQSPVHVTIVGGKTLTVELHP